MKLKLLSLGALTALYGCYAQTLPLPKSERLSTDKIQKIVNNIDHKYPNLPKELRSKVLNSVVRSLDNMIFVEGGEFEMGDFGWPYDDNPFDMCQWPCGVDRDSMGPISFRANDDFTHPVKLSSYHLSKYQAALGDFDLYFMAQGKPLFDQKLRERKDLQYRYQPNVPAFTKTWQEAKDYCSWLGELSGYPVDLPSEAQWEFAARSRGQYVAFSTDNGSLNYGRNFPLTREEDSFAVDKFLPNPLGFYNFSGNATDWVNDWFVDDYYQNSPLENPKGPNTGSLRIRRGSDILEDPVLSASTVRRWADDPIQKRYYPSFSFRCSVQSEQTL